METNNITSAQIYHLLKNLVGNNTYTIVDSPSNRFNFLGMSDTITTEDLDKVKGLEITAYPITNSKDEENRALEVFEENGVDLWNYTHVLEIQDGEDATYWLLWGEITFDVHFNNESNSNNKGFKCTLDECMSYIQQHNGSDFSYFADYKGGAVSVVCNETGENVFETAVF